MILEVSVYAQVVRLGSLISLEGGRIDASGTNVSSPNQQYFLSHLQAEDLLR